MMGVERMAEGSEHPAEMLASTISREAAQFALDMAERGFSPQFRTLSLPDGLLRRILSNLKNESMPDTERAIGWVVKENTRYGGGDLVGGHCGDWALANNRSHRMAVAFGDARRRGLTLEEMLEAADRADTPIQPEPKELAVSPSGELTIVTTHDHFGSTPPTSVVRVTRLDRWLNPAAVTTPEQATEIYEEWQTDLKAAATAAEEVLWE
jgi:hypothetical protein